LGVEKTKQIQRRKRRRKF